MPVGHIPQAAKRFGLHTHCIEWNAHTRIEEEVITSNARSFLHAIGDSNTARESTAIANRGINGYTVFNYLRRRPAIIPHEAVVVRHVY